MTSEPTMPAVVAEGLTREERRLFNVGHSFARQMGSVFVIDQRKLNDFRTYRRAHLQESSSGR